MTHSTHASDTPTTTLEGIQKARKVLAMWLNNKVKSHNQDKWLDLISVVDSVDGPEDILKVLASYLGVKHD